MSIDEVLTIYDKIRTIKVKQYQRKYANVKRPPSGLKRGRPVKRTK